MEKKERERVDGLKTQIEALQQTNAQLKATVAEVKNISSKIVRKFAFYMFT